MQVEGAEKLAEFLKNREKRFLCFKIGEDSIEFTDNDDPHTAFAPDMDEKVISGAIGHFHRIYQGSRILRPEIRLNISTMGESNTAERIARWEKAMSKISKDLPEVFDALGNMPVYFTGIFGRLSSSENFIYEPGSRSSGPSR